MCVGGIIFIIILILIVLGGLIDCVSGGELGDRIGEWVSNWIDKLPHPKN